MKDSDYFDSELNDRTDLEKLKKAYDSCEIANYQTPQTEKLQTVQIKTYLFDRNLTKIEAWAVFDEEMSKKHDFDDIIDLILNY